MPAAVTSTEVRVCVKVTGMLMSLIACNKASRQFHRVLIKHPRLSSSPIVAFIVTCCGCLRCGCQTPHSLTASRANNIRTIKHKSLYRVACNSRINAMGTVSHSYGLKRSRFREQSTSLTTVVLDVFIIRLRNSGVVSLAIH